MSQGTTEAAQTQATGTTTPPRGTETLTRVRREAEQGTIPLAPTTTVLVGRSSKALGAASTTTTSQVVRSMYRSVKSLLLITLSLQMGCTQLVKELQVLSTEGLGRDPSSYWKHREKSREPLLTEESAQCEIWTERYIAETRGTPVRLIEPDWGLIWNRCMKARGWYRTDGL